MLNLLATICIVMGLGGTLSNPVYDAPKESTETKEIQTKPRRDNEVYNTTLDINLTNEQESNVTLSQKIELDSVSQYRFRAYNRKYNIAGSNNSLNVTGNSYDIKIMQQYSDDAGSTWRNDGYIIGQGDITQEEQENIVAPSYWYNNYSYTLNNYAQQLYTFAITPYNFNVETTVRLRLYTNTNITGSWTVEESRMRTHIYSGTDTHMQQLINVQLSARCVKNIIKEIRNINNGYYYNEKIYDTLISNGTNTANNYYTYDIQIAPNTTNYFFISMTPYVKTTEGYGYIDGISLTSASPLAPSTTNSIRFQTTNVIPGGTYEVIDVPGLMFSILTMPFTFISTAFNLTLFPGTPYQLNVSSLFLAIFAILVFIFIMNMIIKASGKS